MPHCTSVTVALSLRLFVPAQDLRRSALRLDQCIPPALQLSTLYPWISPVSVVFEPHHRATFFFLRCCLIFLVYMILYETWRLVNPSGNTVAGRLPQTHDLSRFPPSSLFSFRREYL